MAGHAKLSLKADSVAALLPTVMGVTEGRRGWGWGWGGLCLWISAGPNKRSPLDASVITVRMEGDKACGLETLW